MQTALIAVALPLAATILIECAVAALLGFRWRELSIVAWINCVTNPLLNLVWLALFWLGVGHETIQDAGGGTRVVTLTWMWFLLAGLEVIVVIGEWRLLLAAIGGRARSSRSLLLVSIAMNVVSATLGTFLLSRLF